MPRRRRGRCTGGRGRWQIIKFIRRRESIESIADVFVLEEAVQDVDIDNHPREFFLRVVSTEKHLEAQKKNRSRYAAALSVLQKYGLVIARDSHIRALAIAWARNDNGLAEALLNNRDQFGPAEVLKAMEMLDLGRQIRVRERKLKRLQMSRTKVDPKKLREFKSDIDKLTDVKPPMGSASGSVCKKVAKWVRGLSKEELEFYAMDTDKTSWRMLACACHFHPTNDFAALPWFLPYCFGTDAPEESLVKIFHQSCPQHINSLVMEYDIPYHHLKIYKNFIFGYAKQHIVEYEEKLDTVLWHYEDLLGVEAGETVEHRLAANEPVTLSRGKLLERLLTFKIMMKKMIAGPQIFCFLPRLITLAETQLTSLKLALESPVVVMADKSSYMRASISAGTLVASLLSAITSAQLVFFNTVKHDPSFFPEILEQMLELAVTITAEDSFSPATCLWPFYERKEVVKTFIIVSAEGYETGCHGYRFAALYKKYYDEVYPARLVLISFHQSEHPQGLMVSELKDIGYNPFQFKFDLSEPDLSKLDTLFFLLSSSYEEELAAAELSIKSEGIAKVFESVKK